MNGSQQLTITLALEGSPAERGHVLLDDFLRQLKALQDALCSVDREVNGRSTLDFRVIDLNHSSPATVRLEPILKGQFRKSRMAAKYRNSAAMVHKRFFYDLHTIRFDAKRPDDTSEETIDALRELIDGLGDVFFSGSIFNDASNIPLDVQMSEAFEKLSMPAYKSVGTVIGDLLTISFARGSRFYIYPRVGPTSVACHFAEDLAKVAKANIRKLVRVHGEKLFRPNSGHPFRINVDRIEELKLPKKIVVLDRARKRPYKGEAADIEIGRTRNEW